MTDWILLKETKLRTGAVLEEYRDFADRKAYYVDKTWFIREFLLDPAQVVMYTRPRRFGKTLMLSTVRAFVEKEYDRAGNLIDKRPLFEGRKILDAEPEILEQMGKYPVIWYTLKDCNQVSFDDFSLWMKSTLSNAARRHDYLLDSHILKEDEKKLFGQILDRSLTVSDAANAFVNLSDWIYRDTGVKPIILIDEYDTPLQWAHEYGYYEKVLPIMRSMRSSRPLSSLSPASVRASVRCRRLSLSTQRLRTRTEASPSRGMRSLSTICHRRSRASCTVSSASSSAR